MKLRNTITLCPAVLLLSMAVGSAQPLARVTIRSYAQLSNAVVRVAGAVAPGAQDAIAGHLGAALGLADTTAFNPEGPWELAFWGSAGAPGGLLAVKGPIPDVKKFEGELSPEGLLAKRAKEWVQLGGGIGVIVFKAADAQTEQEKEELKTWEDQRVVPPRQTLELTIEPSEEAKQQVLPFLAMAKMMVTQKMTAATNGPNPKAMGQIFDVYFDGIETFIKGFQQFTLGVGVGRDSLVLEETVSPKPGSDLAKWIRKPAYPVTGADLKMLNPDAAFSGALALGKNPRLVKLAQRFVELSMELQNEGTNQAMGKDLMEVMEKSLPMRVAGSVFLKGHFGFEAVYQFPGSDAATVYKEMKPLLRQVVKTQAGEGKMYSAASFTENEGVVGGIPVDRFSLTVNLENPLYQRPQQKAAIEALMPDGKMEFDYAVKDNRLLAATPDRMKELIEGGGQTQSRPAIAVDDSTVAVGYFNLLALIKGTAGANPGVPETVQERMAKLEPQGTAIRLHIEMDKNARCTEHVPIKFLNQIGHLKDAP